MFFSVYLLLLRFAFSILSRKFIRAAIRLVKLLSIVTVVKDDVAGLAATGKSLRCFLLSDSRLEWVVYISKRSSDLNLLVDAAERYSASSVIVEDDLGIFSAMNRSLKYCKGKFVLFLNAKDLMCEPPLLSDFSDIMGNCLLRVRYRNFWGKNVDVPFSRRVDQGIPYCHQGMILERARVRFPEAVAFGGDYKCFTAFKDEWPFPLLKSGLIWYDSTGVSSENRFRSDVASARIILYEFGFLCFLEFAVKACFRLAAKWFFSLFFNPYSNRSQI